MSLESQAQSLAPDAIVELFVIDLTSIGGSVLRFVQGSESAGNVSFDSNEYTAIDVKFDGLETSGVGALPTPTITLSNTGGVPQTLINTYGDILGCKLMRFRTYARFLDGHSDPDGTAYFGPDIFEVTRKSSENDVSITWELSAAIDQAGKMLPGRRVIRDRCLWRYRVWDAENELWDYSKSQCPYTGSNYFDINDQSVGQEASDVPSRNLSCCKQRFGENARLPFGGFPGVSRTQR